MFNISYNQKGFVALFITILILAVVSGFALSISLLTLGKQEILNNIIKSNQAYYTAEAGVEDALLRLANDMNFSSSYTLSLNDGSAAIEISDIIGGARVIIAEGNTLGRIRKVSIAYQISTQEASFYYGAQAGDGGIIMRNGSVIRGNVFSNGSVVGSGSITDTVVVANNGNRIDGLIIGRDANAHTCVGSVIDGTLTFVSGGSIGDCNAGEFVDGGPNEIQPRDFSVTQAIIDDWKIEAESGGIISGDLTISENTSLGPIKINGNLLIDKAIVTITGTVWVTGTFDVGNKVEVRLDEDSYGDLSGVLIIDGNVQVRNNVLLEGTDSPSSYLLVISTSSSLLETDAAIDVKNNALGSILFTPNGLMVIHNNVELTEATAYKLLLENNAEVVYEMGLANLEFTSGPGGSWEVSSWREIE